MLADGALLRLSFERSVSIASRRRCAQDVCCPSDEVQVASFLTFSFKITTNAGATMMTVFGMAVFGIPRRRSAPEGGAGARIAFVAGRVEVAGWRRAWGNPHLAGCRPQEEA